VRMENGKGKYVRLRRDLKFDIHGSDSNRSRKENPRLMNCVCSAK
jgi:hypothetical protein